MWPRRPTHSRFAMVAESPGQAVNAIVRESMLDRSQVSRIISRLVRQKLIERRFRARTPVNCCLPPQLPGRNVYARQMLSAML